MNTEKYSYNVRTCCTKSVVFGSGLILSLLFVGCDSSEDMNPNQMGADGTSLKVNNLYMIVEPGCFPGCVEDQNMGTPVLEPNCELTENISGKVEPLQECIRNPDGSYVFNETLKEYSVPDGQDKCYAMLVDPNGLLTADKNDNLGMECKEKLENLQFVIQARSGFVSSGKSIVQAQCTLSPNVDRDCFGLKSSRAPSEGR